MVFIKSYYCFTFFNFIFIIAILSHNLANCVSVEQIYKSPNGYSYTLSGLKTHLTSKTNRASSEFDPSICYTSKYSGLMSELKKYQPIAKMITDSTSSGSFHGITYQDTVDFLDTFGHRLAGSEALEKSIDYLEEQLRGLNNTNNIWSQDVAVPNWKRGEELCILTEPVRKILPMFSLGQSIPTPEEGIRAPVIVFNNKEEVMGNLSNIMGKIAVCNYIGVEGDVLNTKDTGYPEISAFGALAILYRSAATFSINSPHTRRSNLYYNTVWKEIPIGYLTIEDAKYLSRLSTKGQSMEIELLILNENHDTLTTSRNLFIDVPGSNPTETEQIILSAHTDSWDVGQGAQDDAVGVFLMLESLRLLQNLNLHPRRTIRGSLWTAEEYGFNGSIAFIKDQSEEYLKKNLSLVMEADYACLTNGGFVFNSDYAGALRENYGLSHIELGCMIHALNHELLGLEHTLGLNYQSTNFGTDLDRFVDLEIPVVSLLGDDGRYFWFHHTEGDTVSTLDSHQLDRCLAGWATASYVFADFDYNYVREGETGGKGSGNRVNCSFMGIIAIGVFVKLII